jgi:hypothetical protein
VIRTIAQADLTSIPFVDLRSQYNALRGEMPAAIGAAVDCLRTHRELRETPIMQGRAYMEAEYDAFKNTNRLAQVLKSYPFRLDLCTVA